MRFELMISCLLDRRFNQLSHGARCLISIQHNNNHIYMVIYGYNNHIYMENEALLQTSKLPFGELLSDA